MKATDPHIAEALERSIRLHTTALKNAGLLPQPEIHSESRLRSLINAQTTGEEVRHADQLQDHSPLEKSLEGPLMLTRALASLAPSLNTSFLVWETACAFIEASKPSAPLISLALSILLEINTAIPDLATQATYNKTQNMDFDSSVVELYDDYVEFCIFGAQKIKLALDESTDIADVRMTLERELSRCRLHINSVCATWNAVKRPHVKARGDADDLSDGVNLQHKKPSSLRPREKRQMLHTLTPRSQQFVHRKYEREKIHRILAVDEAVDGSDIRQCIIHGIAGVGKSETALAYAYQYMHEYDAIFWVDAEEPINRTRTYTNIGKKFGIIAGDMVGGSVEVDRVREELENTNLKWLIIFDNVNTYSDVSILVPSLVSERGAILYTTQLSNLRAPIPEVLIEPFSPGEGADLILQQLRDGVNNILSDQARREYAEQISEIYGGFPLVLNMAGGYIKTGEIRLEDFCEEFRSSSEAWQLPGEDSGTQETTGSDARFDMALAGLKPDAEQLIRILSFMNPDAIPEELIGQKFQDTRLKFLTGSSPKFFMNMAAVLGERNLVKRQETPNRKKYFQIHRYLQHQVLKKISNGKHRDSLNLAFNQAVAIIRHATPNASPIQVPTPQLWLQYEKVLPHLIHLEGQASSFRIEGSVEYARLLSDAGMNMWERGMSVEALKLLEASEKVLDAVDAEEDLLRANIHVIIVLLLWDFGISRRKETRNRIEEALRIRLDYFNRTPPEAYKQSDDVLLYNAMSDHAVTLLQFHDIDNADRIFDECLKRYRLWGTEDKIPYEYAKFYHHKGFCHLYYSELEQAIASSEKAWKLMQHATEPHSSLAYRFQFDFACILLQSGDSDTALKHHLDVLEGRKNHGQYGVLTLQSYYAIGVIKAERKEYDAAIKYFRKALDGARRAGWIEVAKARAEYHLGTILNLQHKDNAQASALLASAEDFLQRFEEETRDSPIPPSERLALLDHMQPVFDARFAGVSLLPFVKRTRPEEHHCLKS